MPRKPSISYQIFCLSSLISFCLSAPAVLAQQDSDEIEQQPITVSTNKVVAAEGIEDEQGDEDATAKLETITVTGSRIKRTEFDSKAPIEIISNDRSALAGLLNATDILQGSSFTIGQQIDDSFSAYVTDGGPGANEVSLRGLGAQRALVLVNGRRWMPTGIGGSVYSVDLTALPDSITDRYEILKDGASSVYGADAIAGVVNVITRQRIDGGNANFAYTYPQIGDGQEYEFDAIWGKTADRWSLSLGASYSRQERIAQWDLDYARCDTRPRLIDTNGDGVVENTDPETAAPLCFGDIYGFVVSPFGWARFDPSLEQADSENPNYDEDINGTFGIPYFTRVPSSGLDNAGAFYRDALSPGQNDVQTERDVWAFNSFGDYDFAIAQRSATAYYELYFNHRKTLYNRGYRQFFPDVPASNPYNPFGNFGPLPAENQSTVTPVLMTYGIEETNAEVDIARHQFFTGLKGEFSSDWTYDLYFGHGYSKGTYRSQALLADQVAASLDAVEDSEGNIVCADLETYPDCVAVNLFSEQALLNGTLSQQARDFLVADTEGTTVYKGASLSGFTTGPLFQLPAGTAAAVIGGEYRKEYIRDRPDPNAIRDNLFGIASAGITEGEDTVHEVYAELEMPLVAAMPGMEELNFNLSGRFTDYESYGSDTTYRASLEWHIAKTLRLRGTRGTSFRAPDLFEQFLADQQGFANGQVDPCKRYREEFEPGDPIYDNCETQDLPDSYFLENQGILVITGGASTLEAEESDTYTYGFVWQPDESGFSIGVNWWDIEVKNTVESLAATTLLNQCYRSIDFASPFCSRVGARESDGNISSIDSSFINVGFQKLSGHDIDFAYEKAFPSFDMLIDVSYMYLNEYSTQILGEGLNYEGKFAYPYHTGESDLIIKYRDWRFFWRMDFLGKTAEDPVVDPETNEVDRVTRTKAAAFHNFSAEYTWGDWILLGTVRNAFDRKPPLIADGSGSLTANRLFNTLAGSGYPLFGRTFVAKIAYEF